MELTEHQLEVLAKAKKEIENLTEIGQVCLMYDKGADAEACMERIKNILKGDETNGMG